jgi:hypothetical protein
MGCVHQLSNKRCCPGHSAYRVATEAYYKCWLAEMLDLGGGVSARNAAPTATIRPPINAGFYYLSEEVQRTQATSEI